MDHDVKTIGSVEEMERFAEYMAQTLHGGDLLLLYGELGSGKTTFVQGLAKALGITDHVTSPTFVIASEYGVPNHSSITTLVHVDLYRLDENNAAQDPSVRDVLSRASEPGRLTVIEWAERLGTGKLSHAQSLQFSRGVTDMERLVTVG